MRFRAQIELFADGVIQRRHFSGEFANAIAQRALFRRFTLHVLLPPIPAHSSNKRAVSEHGQANASGVRRQAGGFRLGVFSAPSQPAARSGVILTWYGG